MFHEIATEIGPADLELPPSTSVVIRQWRSSALELGYDRPLNTEMTRTQ
jgi:hypothetical protein